MMKKLLSLALAVALCLGLTVPALAADQPGDTTVTDAKGNVYTLSNPILYTISKEQIEQISFAKDYCRIEEVGATAVEPKNSILHDISVAYAVPAGTVVTAPSSFQFSGFSLVEIGDISNGGTAVCECMEPPYLRQLELDYRELGWFNTFWVIPCDYAPEGMEGNQAEHVSDIVFFTPEDSGKSNPFASSAPAAPSAPTAPVKSAFTDVAESAWYYDTVTWAVEKGITSGTGDGTTFSPQTTCSVAEILTFLWKAYGSPEPATKENPFTDVPEGSYFYKPALWAYEKGIVSGGALDPKADCTRSMTVTYMWKAADKPASTKAVAFSDVDGGAEYAQAIAWAVEKGITSGTGDGTTFSPDVTCDRSTIVTLLYRNGIK